MKGIKVIINQDRKQVSSKQSWEPAFISDKFRCPVYLVREAINSANKNGKPCRSRKKVEDRLKIILQEKYGEWDLRKDKEPNS